MSYEITLQKLLENTDKELYGRIIHLETKARPLLSYTQGKFPYYTPHDFHHSQAVEENLNWLIPDSIKEKLNKHEIFFLICAAWLHDWGMIGMENEDPEMIRENHHERTEQYFETKYDTLGFSFHEGRIIGKICKGHRKIDLHLREYDDTMFGQGVRVQLRLLSALLRIADETDVTHSRTPEVIYYTINPIGASEEEFKKHLNISGIGQLDEPHKIYINAIAKDPRAAQTLRELTNKIQRELDSVKSILTQNGLFLDMVELKMETRGFIDKPIAFEINRNKIVDLLVGKHLYQSTDVAIRELIQNSIDTCSLKMLINAEYNPKILLTKDNKTLLVSDNGIGMSYIEAKKFLSNIGTSFYQSEDLKKTLAGKQYDPISFFGIGLLSSFLIADGLIIETKKENEEACKFTISSSSTDWKYEKGTLKESGTSITLNLNQEGKSINILESLRRYFIKVSIPIFYKEHDGAEEEFLSDWLVDDIRERFFYSDEKKYAKQTKTIVEVNKVEYDAYLVKTRDYIRDQIFLFKQGVFVCRLNTTGLDSSYCFFINLKTNIIDLQISRENIVENEKFSDFLNMVFCDILDSLKTLVPESNYKNYISVLSEMIDSNEFIEKFNHNDLQLKYPFLNCILNKILFPSISSKDIEFLSFDEIIERKEMCLYGCNSKNYREEMTLLLESKKAYNVFLNPYQMPEVSESTIDERCTNLLDYILEVKNSTHERIDLRNFLIDNSKLVKNDFSKILPSTVRLATFGKFKPLIVVLESPKVKFANSNYGYWYMGNTLLWQQLLEKSRLTNYINGIKESFMEDFDEVNIVENPVVLIDSSDPFIASILNKYSELSDEECLILKRYFMYLIYLPIVFYNIHSCLIFIEVIENIEKSISSSLSITRPIEIFKRMKPNSNLYLEYYKKNGMGIDRIEEEK
jgi:HSP90 family molecular chaperone